MGASTIVRYHHGGDNEVTEYRVGYHVEGSGEDLVVIIDSVTIPNTKDGPDFRYIFENSVNVPEAVSARTDACNGHTRPIRTILEEIEEYIEGQIDG